ncbi:outer membrane protein assembly factor BamB family protein [Robertkochia sediminum]|uniref:outer membrane protein assembly factor BamB family protein n=1 Tax=Robertkochia sediminum TaxID=2785326 RepID=UPI0019344090|nr:PQQ-binding-like beta-propeller repeat protein [Robertkochia sediminum]MBL7472062.1 PQQ-binding-like beta-propeller repeat protein [Robertkochia sediminum]
MKKIKLTIALLIVAVVAHAQNAPETWNKEFPEAVQFQKVSAFGHYLVGTDNALWYIEQETGNIIWSNPEFKNLQEGDVSQVGNSPLISVNQGTTVHMIDPFTGESKFDSKKAGIKEINDQMFMYNADAILVSGRTYDNNDILIMSSLSDGEILWKLEDDFGRFITARDLSDSEVLIVTLYNNYKINTASGALIWKNDTSSANEELDKLGALGGLMKKAAANVAQNMDFNIRFYQNPFEPVFYIASEQEGRAKTSGFSSSVSNGDPMYHTTYTAFSLKDGSRLWKKDLDVNGRMGQLYFHEQGLVILPDDGSKTKINLFDYNTQEGLWGKKGRGIKIKGGVYDYLETDNGLILISQKPNNKNYISFLGLDSGSLALEDPVKINGEVVFGEITLAGLLYVTTNEVNILDIQSGETILDKQIRTSPSLVDQNEAVLYAYDHGSATIKMLDKNTGSVSVLSDAIEFEGKESPAAISMRDNGVLVSSSQNLALVDYSGKTTFQTYLEAPREPGIIKALRYAQAIRAAYVSAASYAGSAVYRSAATDVSNENQAAGALLADVGAAYQDLGDQAADMAKRSLQMANARFKATQEADDYVVILSQVDKTNYLMKVSKNTGEIESRIDLGKDREPSYAMDGITGVVFYKTNTNQVTSYKL